MENRRAFLKKLVPRLLVLGGVFSLQPARWVLGHTDSPSTGLDLSHPRYVSLLKELATRYRFSQAELRSMFGKAALHPEIIEKFERPPEILPYYEYRRRFIRDELIAQARAYLAENLALFRKVEESFGVEKEIICSILGVESKFGQKGIQGFRVFDVLNTAFSSYPRREGFYRAELIEFLLLCREERLDPLGVMGSYAGAFGVPQFMPSSVRRYAVDYDQDGKRDLTHSKGDILASVANYLRTFRWRHKGLLRLPAILAQENLQVKQVLGSGLRSATPVSQLLAMGVKIDPLPDGNEEASLVSYQPKEGEDSFLAVFENFRAITHYNYSTNYALAVIDLAEFLKGKAE